eukprot:scaffold3107_cov189-Skeletonema_marinoi.AAC.6
MSWSLTLIIFPTCGWWMSMVGELDSEKTDAFSDVVNSSDGANTLAIIVWRPSGSSAGLASEVKKVW